MEKRYPSPIVYLLRIRILFAFPMKIGLNRNSFLSRLLAEKTKNRFTYIILSICNICVFIMTTKNIAYILNFFIDKQQYIVVFAIQVQIVVEPELNAEAGLDLSNRNLTARSPADLKRIINLTPPIIFLGGSVYTESPGFFHPQDRQQWPVSVSTELFSPNASARRWKQARAPSIWRQRSASGFVRPAPRKRKRPAEKYNWGRCTAENPW